MRGPVLFSATAHMTLIAVVYFGLPAWMSSRELPTEEIIVVELVDIADETVAAPMPVEPEAKPAPEPPEPPEPPAPEPPAPEPPAPEPEPEPPAPEPAPEPAPQPEPEPEPAPEAEPEPAPEIAEFTPEPPVATPRPRTKPAPPRIVATPRPRTKPTPPPDAPVFDPTRLAALLDRAADMAPPAAAEEAPPVAAARAVITPQPQPAVNQPLSLSETDAFRARVESCWSIPAGAREASELVVTLRIFLNPDGSLAARPEIVDGERMSRPGGEFFRTAAESAIRAVLRCAPYEMLPAAKYDSWRDIRLTFDPRELG